MNLKQMQSTLEAVLFAVGEPIETQRLAQALEWDELILDQLLDNLQAKYDETNAGICLLRLDQRVQLCSRLEYADAIRRVLEVKRNAPLSQAAFEVLAIVAYNQPVTKSFIEQIRGVDCSAVLSNLLQKSLIEERGRLDLPGRPLIYGTTPDFLRVFCISSLDEMPKLPDRPEAEETPADSSAEEKNEAETQTDLQRTVDENKKLL